MPQPLEYEQLGYNPTAGSVYGASSTDRIGFYGVVPIARPITVRNNKVSTVIGNLLIAAKSQADAECIAVQDGHTLRNPAAAQAVKFGGA